ncbi:hypothetical protein Fmac_005562 [Flemingia macrophylla]|uniref:Uncharacterized protein n=1 Tax=Flemingia macrophylla TaxID=520843 RepID=A0ABD1N849_9FABA
MEKKNKSLLLLLLMLASLFCMPNASYAVSDVNFQGHLTNSELVKGPNRRLLAFVVNRCNEGICCFGRLWSKVQGEMQFALKAKDLPESLRNMLFQVQVCSSWHLWEQRGVWKVLR